MRDRKPLSGARSGNTDFSFSLERFDDSGFFPSIARSNGYTLLLIERGRGTLNVGECAITLDNGGLLVALSPYQALMVERTTELNGFLIRFHPDFLCVFKHHRELACDGVLFDDAYGRSAIPLGADDLEEFASLAAKMAEELRGDLEAADEMLLSYLKIFILRAVRLLNPASREGDAAVNPTREARKPVLRAFREAVEVNFRKLHAVEDYAGILGLPAKALSRECVEGMGKGARAVIIDRLIAEAKRELYLTDSPVKAIAYRLGYPDEYHFSRLFKSEVGIPPSTYREKVGSARGMLRRDS